MRPDVAGGHAPRIQRDDPLVEPIEAGLPLADNLRLEGPVAVPGTSRSIAPMSVSTVLPVVPLRLLPLPPGRVVLVIAEMASHLLGQRPPQHRRGHLRQRRIGPEQLREGT
jgi:hypothetical protein